MKHVTILFFATLREITGQKKILKTIPEDLIIKDLKELLIMEYPGLQDIMNSVIIAINHEFAFDTMNIPPDSEIALFPPVSGGRS
jgi:molybdopterin converting factor subunit 1